ncbi:MAG: hypothetical protein HN348_30730, partial [Proteobacteria bacterium]|nr:hypothetical protein [Pseudomonadota bacterium]
MYNQVAYFNLPYADTHPVNLATMADLFGMETPDIETARVLEIGCGDGGNLMGMANCLPRA